MADKDASQDTEGWSRRDHLLRAADNLARSIKMDREAKLRFANLKMQDADIWEKHQRLGHLHHIDGDQMASDLRAMAQRLLEQLG